MSFKMGDRVNYSGELMTVNRVGEFAGITYLWCETSTGKKIAPRGNLCKLVTPPEPKTSNILKQTSCHVRELDAKVSSAKAQVGKLYEIMPEKLLDNDEFSSLLLALKMNIEGM